MHSMKIKRPLPPAPKTATKTIRNDHIYGFGRNTYEYNEAATAIELRIPPTRSNSQSAERERELKVILDMAREGKTATEIAEASGCTKVRVAQTIKRFAEYGAKLTPEKPKRKAKRKDTIKDIVKESKRLVWDEATIYQLMSLHQQGLSYSEIGERLGVTKNSVTCKVKRLVDAGLLSPRVYQAAWSEEDKDKLFRLRADGKTWGEIADILGRKLTACQMAYKRETRRR